MNRIVAEYDYYTLEQARKIILEEERQKKENIRKLRFSCNNVFYSFSNDFALVNNWILGRTMG